jgi:hypothetical protein
MDGCVYTEIVVGRSPAPFFLDAYVGVGVPAGNIEVVFRSSY